MKPATLTGVLGLSITLGMNLAALFVFKLRSAAFFEGIWWASWLPCYIVWLVFVVIGLKRGSDNKSGWTRGS
jgi:hypothetical protein